MHGNWFGFLSVWQPHVFKQMPGEKFLNPYKIMIVLCFLSISTICIQWFHSLHGIASEDIKVKSTWSHDGGYNYDNIVPANQTKSQPDQLQPRIFKPCKNFTILWRNFSLVQRVFNMPGCIFYKWKTALFIYQRHYYKMFFWMHVHNFMCRNNVPESIVSFRGRKTAQ